MKNIFTLTAAMLLLASTGCIFTGIDYTRALETADKYVQAVAHNNDVVAQELLAPHCRAFLKEYPLERACFRRHFIEPYKGRTGGYSFTRRTAINAGRGVKLTIAWRRPGEEEPFDETPLVLARQGDEWFVSVEIERLSISEIIGKAKRQLLDFHKRATGIWGRNSRFPETLAEAYDGAEPRTGRYRWTYIATKGGRGYDLHAAPERRSPVKLYYFISEDGVLRFAESERATAESGPASLDDVELDEE